MTPRTLAEPILVGREKELEELRLRIEDKEQKIANIDLKLLSEKGRMLVNDIANIEKQIAQLIFEKQKAVDEIEKARAEIQEFASEYNRLDNERSRLNEILALHKDEKNNCFLFIYRIVNQCLFAIRQLVFFLFDGWIVAYGNFF